MARQQTIFVTGKINNLVFYKWKDLHCVRSMPLRVKQTKATKQSAKDFGRAAKLSRILRNAFSPLLPDYKNRKMTYRLNASLLHWLRQKKSLKNISFIGFEFDRESELSSHCRQPFATSFSEKGKIIVTIPRLSIPQDILAPPDTKLLRLRIVAAGCSFDDLGITDHCSTIVELPFENGVMPQKQVVLKFNCDRGNIALVGIALIYCIETDGLLTEVKKPGWTPAAIVSGFMK